MESESIWFVSVYNLTTVVYFGSCIGAHGSVFLRITSE